MTSFPVVKTGLSNFCLLTNQIDSFKKNWQNSSASQLLIHDINSAILDLGAGSGFQASIALMAFRNGCLSKLDRLMDYYNIPDQGTKAFKKKLDENWLEHDPEERRNIANDTLSAITELAAAYFLEKNGYEIKNLEAWGGPNDISCRKNGTDFGFEVKLFPDSPEFYKLRLDAARSESGVACDSTPPHPVALNYYYFRLAQANIQLRKTKNADIPAIFFVFTEGANQFFIDELIKSLGSRKEWYKEEKEEAICIPGILPKDKLLCEALSKTPDEWFNETKTLYIAKMKKYCLDCIYSRSVFS